MVDLESLEVELGDGQFRSVGQLVTGWDQHIARIAEETSVEDDRTAWGAHDYFAALSLRSILNDSAEQANPDARSQIFAAVEATDDVLRRITELDREVLVVRFGDATESARRQWWWARIPTEGLVRRELELWSRDVRPGT